MTRGVVVSDGELDGAGEARESELIGSVGYSCIGSGRANQNASVVYGVEVFVNFGKVREIRSPSLKCEEWRWVRHRGGARIVAVFRYYHSFCPIWTCRKNLFDDP